MNRFAKAALAAAFLAGASGAGAGGFQPAAPEDLIFYMMMVDRFDDGDPSNNAANPRTSYNPASPSGWHGGDLEGVRRRLPYIAALGCNAIWLSPIVENVNSYHGYGAYNWYNVDPNFGTMEELQQLVGEAGSLGIGIYLDLVANHCGDLVDSGDPGWSSYRPPPATYTMRWRGSLQYPAPFNSLAHFHAHGGIGNYSVPEQELGELFGLDDLKTETPYVRDAMVDIWTHWLREGGVAGFRVDTVKHTEAGFWNDFLPRLRTQAASFARENFFVFGELYGADDNYMRQYTGTLTGQPFKFDSILDFQFYYASNGVFAYANRPPSDIANRIDARAAALGAHHLQMPNWIDSHDQRRFLNAALDNPGSGLAERTRRLDLALAFLMTAPGPPIIYYGTEQGFSGGGDPNNREDMFDGQFESGPSAGDNFNTSSSGFRRLARLGALRRDLAPLRRGSFVTRGVNTTGPGLLAYSRLHEGEEVLVVLNTSTNPASQPAIGTSFLAGKRVVNALDPLHAIDVGIDGQFPARIVDGQAAEIWVPEKLVPPPAPEVSGMAPANGETGVALDTAITIRFLAAMNHPSTEAAVSIVPSFGYAASWSAESDELVLTPTAPLVPQTDYTVTVAASAQSVEGQSLAFPASATWRTARIEAPLPPMPATLANLTRTAAPPVINGNDSDWPPSSSTAPNSFSAEDGKFLWRDATGDDTGAGAYLYPTNAVFTGGDADIAEFRFAFDAASLFFAFKPASINPSASFFTAYFGVAIDTAPGGMSRPLGIDQSAFSLGAADLLVRGDAAPEFELTFTGPRGAFLHRAAQDDILAPVSDFSQATGFVEIAVPRADVGLDRNLAGDEIRMIAYAGLETFGTLREVAAARGAWEPGGGSADQEDPDVFDLAGASAADQAADLSDYGPGYASRVRKSIISLRLYDGQPPAGAQWTMF